MLNLPAADIGTKVKYPQRVNYSRICTCRIDDVYGKLHLDKEFLTLDSSSIVERLQNINHSYKGALADQPTQDGFDDIRDWVAASIEYKTNEEQRGVDEYWQTPEETLSLRSGDCEDFAILLCTFPEPTVSVRSACRTLLVLMMDVLTCLPSGELVSGRRMTGDWLPGSYSSVSWSSQVQPRRC